MEPNLIGQTLGKYRILEEIGRGGMGSVYKAHDTVLDRLVAIKVLAPHLTWDQEFVQRFLHEARSAARLKHPHIVTIYDVGQVEGHHFIVMDYLEGQSLSTLIRREGPLPPGRVALILGQIAQALDYAHAQGLVHRDVKPGNVIIGPDDRATLTDFGVAKALAGTRLTQTGTLLGTPAYMAPEQVKGQAVGPTTDVYALGVVAYEMLGGRPPFEADTPHALMHAQVYETPPPLRQVNPRVSPGIETAVLKALAKEPGQRYGTAAAFATALRQAVASRGPGLVREPPPPTPPSPSARRRTVQALPLPVLGALGAALLLVVLVFVISRLSSGPATLSPTGPASGATPIVMATQAPVTPIPRVGARTAIEAPPTGAAQTKATANAAATQTAAAEAATQTAVAKAATRIAVAATKTAQAQGTAIALAAERATATAQAAHTPTPTCRLPTDPQLASAWDQGKLGCPTAHSSVTWAAWEPFETGYMFWRSDTDRVYVLYLQDGSNLFAGRWLETPEEWKWDGGNPDGVGMSPPPGLYEPKRGFGWLWRTHLGGPDSQLRWAREEEKGFCTNIQPFEKGLVLRSSTVRYCEDELYNWATHPSFAPLFFTLYGDGTWRRY